MLETSHQFIIILSSAIPISSTVTPKPDKLRATFAAPLAYEIFYQLQQLEQEPLGICDLPYQIHKRLK